MSNNNRIKLTNIITKLPEEAIDILYETAFSLLDMFSIPDKPACPYCGNHHVVKNGHKCRKQEFLCKCCGKTYVSTTNTLMANSRQPGEVWEKSSSIPFPAVQSTTLQKRRGLPTTVFST